MPPISPPIRRTCLALLMLCVALPSFAVKPPKEDERWIVVGAGNVAVYSNATDEEARAVAAEVLRVREAAVVISRLDATSLLPVKVYLFRDAATFAAYRKALLPRKNGSPAAYTLATPEVILLVLQAGGSIDRPLAEELADQFLAGASAKPARWSSDRFAESLATSTRDAQLANVAKPVEMARDEVLYQLGYLLGRGDPSNRRDAETFLSQAVRLNPKHAGAYDDLGLLHVLANRHAQADVAFSRALALEAENPNLYVRYGMMLLDQLERRPAGQIPSPEVIRKMRDLFGKAAELDPGNALAHMGLGATYMFTPDDSAPGIAELEKSVQLAPGNEQALLLLMQLYARAGRRDDTQRTAALVTARTRDVARLQSARESLLLADFIYASKLLLEEKQTSGKLNEAATLLRHVHSETKDQAEKARVGTLLKMVDVLRLKSQAEELKAILDLANSGKVKEALAQVDALMPQLENEMLLKAARKLRADLARAGQ